MQELLRAIALTLLLAGAPQNVASPAYSFKPDQICEKHFYMNVTYSTVESIAVDHMHLLISSKAFAYTVCAMHVFFLL